MIQVMLDLETFGTRPTSAIVSIGAVKFTVADGIIDKFKVNLDPRDAKSYGMTYDKDTLEWWATQSKDARSGWSKDSVDYLTGIKTFLSWYGDEEIPTWSKGKIFDFPMLEHSIKTLNLPVPWKYSKVNDYRTLINAFKINDFKLKQKGSITHDSLVDCIEQTKVLIPILSALEEFEGV